MAQVKFGKGDTKNFTLEQHEAARKEAKARKHRGHGNTTATASTNSTPATTFKVTRIEDIISRLDAEKAEEDRKALKRAEQIKESGVRTLTLEDLADLKRAAEINAEAETKRVAEEAAAKAKAEAEAAAKAKAEAEVAKKAERNKRVQQRKAERQQALAGGGLDLSELFGLNI